MSEHIPTPAKFVPSDVQATIDTRRPEFPGAATTFWISLLFGIFGLVPMLMHSGEARRAGQEDTSNYVGAFVAGLACCVILSLLILAGVSK